MPHSDFRPPAPGDELWYIPSGKYPSGPSGRIAMRQTSAHPAIVVRVHSARLVDLIVTDAAGDEHVVSIVALVQPGDPNPGAMVGHCQWNRPADPVGADQA